MPELDTDLTRAVEALRSARSPDAGAQARVHARLEAILLAPGGGGGDGGGDGDLGGGDGLAELGSSLGGSGQAAGAGAGGAGIAFAAKVVGATASLTAAGLLTLKLGAMAIGGLSSGPAREPAPDVAPVVASVDSSAEGGAPSAVVASAVEPEPASSADEPAPVVSPREAAPASKPGKPAAAVAPEPAPTDASDIQAELAHIDAARRATSPSQAITQLRAHAEAFPDGALRDERDALWAIASCELDQLDDARRRTAALAERRPSSPLLERIAKACPSLEP